jgi:hypothetical protein
VRKANLRLVRKKRLPIHRATASNTLVVACSIGHGALLEVPRRALFAELTYLVDVRVPAGSWRQVEGVVYSEPLGREVSPQAATRMAAAAMFEAIGMDLSRHLAHADASRRLSGADY